MISIVLSPLLEGDEISEKLAILLLPMIVSGTAFID